MPYEPRVPASSNCVAFQSTALYAAASASSSGASGSSSGTRTATSVPSATSSGSGTNGAMGSPSFNLLAVGSVAVSAFVGLLAVL
ncbi:hypothetical protein BN14_03476 [Rhizoctonia solani AG-1 IB]|nr:hypothetical protein BN14_03476 [Rhizoctonia solani AG-1 IB]